MKKYAIFAPILGPFVVLGVCQSVFWIAGAETNPEALAMASLVVGGVVGFMIIPLIDLMDG